MPSATTPTAKQARITPFKTAILEQGAMVGGKKMPGEARKRKKKEKKKQDTCLLVLWFQWSREGSHHLPKGKGNTSPGSWENVASYEGLSPASN